MCILYVFGYKIDKIIDIFVKMNTNTTQNALHGFRHVGGSTTSDNEQPRTERPGAVRYLISDYKQKRKPVRMPPVP